MKTATATKSKPAAKKASVSTKKTSNSAAGKTTAARSRKSASTQMKEPASKENSPFEKMFEDILKDTLWAEQHIVASLPKMIEAASTESLKEALEDHLHITKKQVRRLEKVFQLLGKDAKAVKCPVMEALVKEGNKMIEETPEGSMTRDAGIIISAQKIEHYEIAAYGSLMQVALTLGHDDAADLLEQTLMEESDADEMLSEIAETEVNPMADYDEPEQEEQDTEEEQDEPIEEPVEAEEEE